MSLTRHAVGAVAAVLTCAAALVVASAAAADDYTRKVVAADQAAAKAAVLRTGDFGPLTVKGGPVKPSAPDGDRMCSYFDPKESDLVLTGEAESAWQATGIEFRSSVLVLRTKDMVRTDWKRTFVPICLRCMADGLKKEMGSTGKLISLKRMSFPKIGEQTYAFRLVMDMTSGATRVRLHFDWVTFTQGRTEGMLM